MSRSGFDLLVGWLTEGYGGEALGSGNGFTGERGKRGRTAVMRVVNNHLRFDGNRDALPARRQIINMLYQLLPQILPLSLLMLGRNLQVFYRPLSLKQAEVK